MGNCLYVIKEVYIYGVEKSKVFKTRGKGK